MIKKAFTENGNGGEVLEYLDQLATEIVNNQIKSEESKTSVNDSTLYKSKLYRRFKREASALNKVQKLVDFNPVYEEITLDVHIFTYDRQTGKLFSTKRKTNWFLLSASTRVNWMKFANLNARWKTFDETVYFND